MIFIKNKLADRMKNNFVIDSAFLKDDLDGCDPQAAASTVSTIFLRSQQHFWPDNLRNINLEAASYNKFY